MPKDLSSNQVGLQGKSAVNDPKSKVYTGRTRFPMMYRFPNTYRYGHVQPFYYQHTIGDDDIPLYSQHDLSTYTLSSPLKDPVTMTKSYFLVDYKALYPRNWDLMYMAPNKGDDVPVNNRFITSNLLKGVSSRLSSFKSAQISEDDNSIVTDWIRFVLFCESIFSAGSLLAQFNIHLQNFAFSGDFPNRISFDIWFDTVFVPWLRSNLGNSRSLTIDLGGSTYRISPSETAYFDSDSDIYYVSTRRFLELIRDNSFIVTAFDFQPLSDVISSLFISVSSSTDYPLNLEVIAAYQLGCAQFFTDSHIDYVYSARLYRDLLESVIEQTGSFSSEVSMFSYNGTRKLYDVLSGHNFDIMNGFLSSLPLGNSYMNTVYNYMILIFGHRNSLRFGDYFVSGRTNPYTSTDLAVDTSGAEVSILDITRKIQLQRFWNKVGISVHKIGEYARNVMGLSSADDNSYDIPAFLGNKKCFIGGMDIENTGAAQRDPSSITSVLKANDNVHAFDIHTKRPGIVIGVLSFDVPRTYSQTIDRMHMHLTRFDDYVPELQYIGDQQIYQRELDATQPVNGIFAYSLRYMEYKQRYHYAAGGAIESLKSWYMITDNKDGNPFTGNIDPDYIRSQPSEFDRFYSSLSGYSLGTYFHFNVLNINYQKLTRDMVLAPEPLK